MTLLKERCFLKNQKKVQEKSFATQLALRALAADEVILKVPTVGSQGVSVDRLVVPTVPTQTGWW